MRLLLLLFFAHCSKSIRNGREVVDSSFFPWNVWLPTNLCSGTILSRTTILVSAHCVCRVSASAVTVETLNGRRYGVSSKIEHPRYLGPCGAVNEADLALLRTSGPIAFDHAVQPIGIDFRFVPEREPVLHMGFGADGRSQELGRLHYANTTAHRCRFSTASMLCSSTATSAIVEGDSGGALVTCASRRRPVQACKLVGVISGYTANNSIYVPIEGEEEFVISFLLS